jgi:His-Xaa-Ser system radical SAM maturase HxsC
MCSQPPKKTHVDQFADYAAALRLAPHGSVIGLSGGEPTLHKAKLLSMMESVGEERPDIRFHVLTNAQHFSADDLLRFRHPVYRQTLWGVPLYSATPVVHDRIVKKIGAFEQLRMGLDIMAEGGLHLELRTVLLRDNYSELPNLARLVAKQFDYIDVWAIMQLEKIGFASNRWTELFHDHTQDIDVLEDTVAYAKAFGLDVSLFNFPRCTLPISLRGIAAASISDWKADYAQECDSCDEKPVCGGLFAWHKTLEDYAIRGPV